jgi:hypothetical protein
MKDRNNGTAINASAMRPRTLLFSRRNAARMLPFRCAHSEFEDVISEVDSVEFTAPRVDHTTPRYQYAKMLAYHTPLVLNPGVERKSLDSDYDLFFAICGDPSDLLAISTLGNWRSRCKKAVCVIDELWVRQMPAYDNFLKMLRQFDLVCLYYCQSVEPLNKIIGNKCIYLPPAVDTIRFCPYPDLPERVVDIYSIGRRSAITHEALMQLAARENLFYVYDSTSADRVFDPIQHRELYARTLKRSRYFIVNPGLIDRPDVRGNQIEIGYRYFDGIAAGAINIGERPTNDVFPQLFDWDDSVIHFPYNSTHFEELVQDLENDPEREAWIRCTNVQHALLRHDFVYRWETILKAINLEALPALAERKARLHELAELAMQALPGRVTAPRGSKLQRVASLKK